MSWRWWTVIGLLWLGCWMGSAQTAEPQVGFPLGWYTFPEIANAFSVEGRTVECAANLRQQVALIHLKPRNWSQAKRLISSGLDVRFRPAGENRWVMEREPSIVAREKRWRQQFKAHLVQSIQKEIEFELRYDGGRALVRALPPEQWQELVTLLKRLEEWDRQNPETNRQKLLETAPISPSEVSAPLWRYAESCYPILADRIKKELLVDVGSNRTLQTKATLILLTIYAHQIESTGVLDDLPLELLLELSQQNRRITRWCEEWWREWQKKAEAYREDEEAYRANLDAAIEAQLDVMPLGRYSFSEALWRAIEPLLPKVIEELKHRGEIEAEDNPERQLKRALLWLLEKQSFRRYPHYANLCWHLLGSDRSLRTALEEAFEKRLVVRAVRLSRLVEDPTLRAWLLDDEDVDPEKAPPSSDEWAFIYSLHWKPEYLSFDAFYIPIHITGHFPTYSWISLYSAGESSADGLEGVFEALDEEAQKLLQQWRAETERVLQSPLGTQKVAVKMHDSADEGQLRPLVRWVQASQVEVIMELTPARWHYLSFGLISRSSLSLQELYQTEIEDGTGAANNALQMRLEEGVLIIFNALAFLDRWIDYPAAALLRLHRRSRAPNESLPCAPWIEFCQEVSPMQVRWLDALYCFWLECGRNYRDLPAFYRLYRGMLTGRESLLKTGGEIRFEGWTPPALQQTVLLWQSTMQELFWINALVYHPSFAQWLRQHPIKIEPIRFNIDKEKNQFRWRLECKFVDPDRLRGLRICVSIAYPLSQLPEGDL